MFQYPPIIIINGVDNDNDNTQENYIMPECPSHGKHELQLMTHDREFKDVKEDLKAMTAALNERVKGKVFWTMVLLMFAAMGTIFSKQDNILTAINEVSTSQQLVQKDIQNMKDDITELKGAIQ